MEDVPFLTTPTEPFKPIIVIDRSKGTIEVQTEDCSITERDGIYIANRDNKTVVGALFNFSPSVGFRLEVRE